MWDPIPREPADPAFQTWAHESARRTGAANVWAQLSVDTARDLVFVPTSSPSPDYYGGERLGSNSYADSVVALRGSSGWSGIFRSCTITSGIMICLPSQPNHRSQGW